MHTGFISPCTFHSRVWSMAEAKLELVRGRFEFRAEGGESWLAQQFDKVLATLPPLTADVDQVEEESPADNASAQEVTGGQPARKNVPLAAFLKEKNATVNQRRKFLATAVWLHDQRDQKRVTTGDVIKALAEIVRVV